MDTHTHTTEGAIGLMEVGEEEREEGGPCDSMGNVKARSQPSEPQEGFLTK